MSYEPPANSSIIFLKKNPNRKIILEKDHDKVNERDISDIKIFANNKSNQIEFFI